MANSALFSPLVLPTGGLRVWYCRVAQGQPGVLVIEATAVRDVPSGPLLRINDDTFVPGLAGFGHDR